MPLAIDDIESEILGGFSNEKQRMACAYDNRRFYEGHFEEYSTRQDGRGYDRFDFRRTSRIMARIVNTLCAHLYRKPPIRKVPGDAGGGTATLARIYQRNAMAARWMSLDKMTVVGDFAGLQFAGGTDPAAPTKILLRDADQLAIWLDPDDATRPAAVGVVEGYDAKRIMRLWTPDEVRTYETPKTVVGLLGMQSGGTAYRFVGAKANPYRDNEGQGLLPFSFAHFGFPAVHFFSGGIGSNLKELNDHLNFRLDSLSDAIRYMNRPIGIASGVSPGWTPPREVKPGDFINLNADGMGIDANGDGPTPTLSYLVSDTAYIAADWADLNNYIDHSLEMADVPPGSIRFAEAAQSGIALVIKQGPLISFAECRRTPFTHYEADAARIAFMVGASHLEAHRGDGKPLRAAADAIESDGLQMRWPRFTVLPPGAERDQADAFEIENGFTSKIQVVMDRFDLTRDQALEQLQQVVDDNADLVDMGIDPGSTPYQPPAPEAPPEDPNAGSGTNKKAGLDTPPTPKPPDGQKL